MGNKTQLQEHNSTLQNQILTAIQNLPGGVSYTGDNPLTIGEEGATIPANTLLKEALQIINGVEPGVTGIDYGIVTPNTVVEKLTVNHNLGVKPKRVFLYRENSSSYINWITIGDDKIGYYDRNGLYEKSGSTNYVDISALSRTNTQFTIDMGYHASFYNKPYTWIALA